MEKCKGYVKYAPGGRVLRLKEITKLILDDPVKPVKWHHKKDEERLFSSNAKKTRV